MLFLSLSFVSPSLPYSILSQDLAPLHLRIGISSVEALTAAIAAHPALATDTTLPYLLPYLAIHANQVRVTPCEYTRTTPQTHALQAYLVSRIAALASGSCLTNFSWASGGPQPADEKGTFEEDVLAYSHSVTNGNEDSCSYCHDVTPLSATSSSPSSTAASPHARFAARAWTDSMPTDTQLVSGRYLFIYSFILFVYLFIWFIILLL